MDCELTIDVESIDLLSDMAEDLSSECGEDRKSERSLSPRSKEDLRLRVNSRERHRMHDLNSAMDALRQVMPYAQGPSVKKISKMNTLLLARNYIVLLKRSIEEMKRLLAEVCISGAPLPPLTSPLGLYPTSEASKRTHPLPDLHISGEKCLSLKPASRGLPKMSDIHHGVCPPGVAPLVPVPMSVAHAPTTIRSLYAPINSHIPCPCVPCTSSKPATSYPGSLRHHVPINGRVTPLPKL